MDFNNLGFELLGKMISTGALHNSAERYDAPKCHPQTREVVLKEIMDWIMDDEIGRKTTEILMGLWSCGGRKVKHCPIHC